MLPQEETRKLAAVMFADIEGYTALFQRNEKAAIKQVEDHRVDLDAVTRQHNGEIIQFYGDGSVTTYESVIDAVQSALAFQLVSAEHRIPVRIGIHMGDLVYKHGDIFGDVVNIASRIQSAGVPGSVLVSRKVVDELTNHPEIHFTRLGMYALKNVREQIELFALTGRGLTIPPKPPEAIRKNKVLSPMMLIAILFAVSLGYFLYKKLVIDRQFNFADERIIIPRFEDYTMDSIHHQIGDLASSQISNDLSGSTEANVTRYTAMLGFTNADAGTLINNPALARKIGAKYIFQGAYSYKAASKDSLDFWVSIMDTRTENLLPVNIPHVYCSSDNYMDCINEMTDFLKGYWKSKNENYFSIPNEKARIAYLNAQRTWADPDAPEDPRKYLIEAIQEAPYFLNPYFLLLDGLNNEGEYDHAKDTIQLVRQRFTEMSPRQESYLKYYEADLNGKNTAAFNYFMEEHKNDPEDPFLNTTGIVMAVEYLNDPLSALAFINTMDTDSMDLANCVYCRTRITMAIQAYMDLSDKVNASKLAAHLSPYAVKAGQLMRLIQYNISIQDTLAIESLITNVTKRKTPEAIPATRQYYYLMSAQYALLAGNLKIKDHFLAKANFIGGNSLTWLTAKGQYLNGNFQNAEGMYKELLKSAPDFIWYQAELGLIYAKTGHQKKAVEIIEKLKSLKTEYDYGLSEYLQARILAHLGDHKGAIRQLGTALEEGIKFQAGTTFQHDPDLIVLNSEPDYIKLLGQNRRH